MIWIDNLKIKYGSKYKFVYRTKCYWGDYFDYYKCYYQNVKTGKIISKKRYIDGSPEYIYRWF